MVSDIFGKSAMYITDYLLTSNDFNPDYCTTLLQKSLKTKSSKKSSYYKNKYESISKRRGKKRTIIAIARMILTAIYHMLVFDELFNPRDFHKIDMPQAIKEKQTEKAIKQAFDLFVSQGILKV